MKKLPFIFTIMILVFSLPVLGLTFKTMVIDVDTNLSINNSHVIMLNAYTQAVSEKDAGDVATFTVDGNTLYFITYSASGYGADTDALYFDSGLVSLDSAQSPVELESNGFTTTCEFFGANDFWNCEVDDGQGDTGYFVVDDLDKTVMKVNNLNEDGNTYEYFFTAFASDIQSKDTLSDVTVKVGSVTKTADSLANFILPTDKLYQIDFSKSGYTSKSTQIYMDKRLSTCDESATTCTLAENEDGYSTSCVKDGDFFECTFMKDGVGRVFLYDPVDEAVGYEAELQKAGMSSFTYKTWAVDEETDDELDSITVTVGRDTKTGSAPEFTVSTNQVFSITYEAEGYGTEEALMFVDADIGNCNTAAGTCELETGGFITEGVFFADYNLWSFTVEQGEYKTAYMYDLNDDKVKQIRIMALSDEDTEYPVVSNMVPTQGATVYDRTPLISAEVSDNVGIDGDSIELTLDGAVVAHNLNSSVVSYTPVENLDFGEHEASLRVSDTSGNTYTRCWSFTVANQAPIADASSDETSVEVGESISFNAGLSYDPDGDSLTFSWDFGDGNSATGLLAAHSYSTSGTYTVTLNVTDEHGSSSTDTISISVSVENNAPVADAGNDQTVSVNDEVQFDSSGSSDPDGDSLTFSWDFGDGTILGVVNPTHNFTEYGNYTVVLTVTDEYGSSDTDSVKIIVNGIPTAVAGGPYTGYVNESLGFDGTDSSDDEDGLQYKWEFGDGSTGSGENPTHTYTQAGTYTVKLTVIDVDGLNKTDMTTATITEKDTPAPAPEKKDKEVTFARITSVNSEFALPGDYVKYNFKLANTGDCDMEDVKIKAIIPELAVWRSVGPFDIDEDDEVYKQLLLEIPEYAVSGEEYMVRFKISQGGEHLRTKHRFIRVIQ